MTETLVEWGLEPVAVTRFCEQPDLLAVGGTKNPDLTTIIDLQPDLVVMDREENRSEDAAALTASGLEVLALHVRSLDDVTLALDDLARAVGVAPVTKAEVAVGVPPVRLRAWIPIWRRPWMSISDKTYGSSILEATGVENVLAGAETPYPTVTLDDVRGLRSEVVLAPSEPYAFGSRHRAELATVAPVIFVDGKDLFWWGSRTPGALERLRGAIGAWAAAVEGH
ncbi:MAG: helical backbone metal receptor [Actinomycetota bacterium]|nr:helical backbone metal receptor [Actinomycetota bacterium]